MTRTLVQIVLYGTAAFFAAVAYFSNSDLFRTAMVILIIAGLAVSFIPKSGDEA